MHANHGLLCFIFWWKTLWHPFLLDVPTIIKVNGTSFMILMDCKICPFLLFLLISLVYSLNRTGTIAQNHWPIFIQLCDWLSLTLIWWHLPTKTDWIVGVGRLFLLCLFWRILFNFKMKKFVYHGTINGTLKGEFVHVVYSTRGGGVLIAVDRSVSS